MPLGQVGKAICPLHPLVGSKPAVELGYAKVALVEAGLDDLPWGFLPVSGDACWGVDFDGYGNRL